MVFRKLSTGFVAAMIALQVTTAFGQLGGRNPRVRAESPLPPEFGFSYHHASTALEGARRGQAQMTYATGAYWLLLSQALICQEEARQFAIENQERFVKSQRTRWAVAEADRQCRIVARRQANEAARQSTYEVYRLTPKQLDRTTGAIVWPQALLGPEYDDTRNQLDAIFRDEALDAGSLTVRTAEVAGLVRKMSDDFRRNRGRVHPRDYLATQKFLCGVKLEAAYPAFDRRFDMAGTTVNGRSSE